MNVSIRDFDRRLQASRSSPAPSRNPRDVARERLRGIFDAAFPDPHPMNSLEDAARADHTDISAMPLDEILRERILLKIRWALADRPSEWLEGRLARLDGEAAVRRPAARRR